MAKRQKKPRNPDHVHRVNVPGPEDEIIQAQFEALLSPAIYAQSAYYRCLQLRNPGAGVLKKPS